MFGRLSENKRIKAVELMCEMTERIAELFITWSTEESFFLTPKKAYIDELYILSTMPIALPYLVWRKKRLDANMDLNFYLTPTFLNVYEKNGSDWPFRIKAEGPSTFLPSIFDLMEERFNEYEIAWHDEFRNKKAEIKKQRHRKNGMSDEMLGTMNTDRPFVDLVARRLFDVDPKNENKMKEYIGFGGQVMPALSKHGDIFLQYLKRL